MPTDYDKLREACPLLDQNHQDRDDLRAAARKSTELSKAVGDAYHRLSLELERDKSHATATREQRHARILGHPRFTRAEGAEEAGIEYYREIRDKEGQSQQAMEQAALEAHPELHERSKQERETPRPPSSAERDAAEIAKDLEIAKKEFEVAGEVDARGLSTKAADEAHRNFRKMLDNIDKKREEPSEIRWPPNQAARQALDNLRNVCKTPAF